MDAQTKDRLELNLADHFPMDLSDAVFAALLARAVVVADTESDAAVVDGEWADATDYAGIAARVMAEGAEA
jgi:hypothetical protein